MKTITLIYGNDEASQAALKEIQHIQNKYSDKILINNIKFIFKTDLEYQEIDETINIYPTLFFIDDLKVKKLEGYDLTELDNNYWEDFLDFFKLLGPKPTSSSIWDNDELRWKEPVIIEKEPDLAWDEESNSWITKNHKLSFEEYEEYSNED